MKLSDLADVFLGVSRFSSISNTNKLVFEYNILRFENDLPLLIDKHEQINTQPCYFDKPINQSLLVKKGDIIAKLGLPIKAIFIDFNPSNLLIPSSCCLIRPKKETKLIDNLTLWQLLNSPTISRSIKDVIQSSIFFINTIKLKDFKEISINMEDINYKTKILYKKINELINHLDYKKKLLNKLIVGC